MAKRRRLAPAAALSAKGAPPLPVSSRAPIAEVTGSAAAQAAFDEVSDELLRARSEGRMIVRLPLDAVVADHLIRDRVALDTEDMAVLERSLQERGQQMPIEVVDLGAGRYGLISGWRRLCALRKLAAEPENAGQAAASVQALIRTPEDAGAAYRAMVEENEIRANISFYERARIVVKAVEQGVYTDPKEAVQALFSAARAPKRSKILAFTALVSGLENVLRFPEAIPEKLGLALVAALQEDPGFASRLSDALQAADPTGAEGERALLERMLRQARGTPRPPAPPEVVPGVHLQGRKGHVTLSGKGVDAALLSELRSWLQSRSSGA